MAVMHEETFKIYHEDQTCVPDGYVYIDELIAPTIAVLNQKGYTTTFCCAGHPENDWFLIDDGEESGFSESGNARNAYIAFAKGIELPSLPGGFETERYDWDDFKLTIRKRYVFDDDYFERAQQILETMKELYEWALTLPEFEQK
ncbi:MAG: hypothetical protein IJX93_07875 [Clostridia bacterium]|nr:hypothetical protein [Clostridia bacterium]